MRHLGQEQHVPPDTSGPASLQLATGPAFPRLPEPPPHKYRLPDCLIRVDQRACSSRQARLSPACPNHLHTNTACPIASYESSLEPVPKLTFHPYGNCSAAPDQGVSTHFLALKPFSLASGPAIQSACREFRDRLSGAAA